MSGATTSIEGLNPITDSEELSRRTLRRHLAPVGTGMLLNLIYAINISRSCGSYEGAAVTDRDGRGLVHRTPDERADDTIGYLVGWIHNGSTSSWTDETVTNVRRAHDHHGKSYSMSNETFLHGTSLFCLQLNLMRKFVGAPELTDAEKTAQVEHWRSVAEKLGVKDIPTTWEGMEAILAAYEGSEKWFGPSASAHACSEAAIEQFTARWFPRPLGFLGRTLVLSLTEPHVLRALGQRPPPRFVVAAIRAGVRMNLFVTTRLLPATLHPDLSLPAR